MVMSVLIFSAADSRTGWRSDDREDAIVRALSDQPTLRELDLRAGAIPHDSSRKVDRNPDLSLILHGC